MQLGSNGPKVSFGKFTPVKVWLDGRELNPNKVQDEEDLNKITELLCRNLRKTKDRKDLVNSELNEQQRRHFQAYVKDYKPLIGKQKYYQKKETPSANVTTINVKDRGRFLITGKDIDIANELGTELGHFLKHYQYPREYYKMEKADREAFRERVLQKGKDRRQAALQRTLGIHKLDETLNISAISTPTKRKKPTYADLYRIALIDFKA